MSLKGFSTALGLNPEFCRHLERIARREKVPEIALSHGAMPCYMGALRDYWKGPLLVLTPRPEDARRLYDQLLTYLGETESIHLLPEADVLPFERLTVDANTSNQRMVALAALASYADIGEGSDGSAPLLIASISAALRKTVSPAIMSNAYSKCESGGTLFVGQRIRLHYVLSSWSALGYRNEPVVETRGSFSHRGGIIDVYPPDSDLPFRIELWDDQIENIRQFDPFSQRSVMDVKQVSIIPAREQLPGMADRSRVVRQIAQMDLAGSQRSVQERMEEELTALFDAPNVETLSFYNGLLNEAGFLDYLPASSLVVLDRKSQIEGEARELEERTAHMRLGRENRGELPRWFPSPHMAWEEFSAKLSAWQMVSRTSWVGAELDQIFRSVPPNNGRLDKLASYVGVLKQEGKAIVAVTQHVRRLAEILEQDGISVVQCESLDQAPQLGQIYILSGSLQEGWTLSDGKGLIILLTDSELFGTVKQRRFLRVRPGPSRRVVHADLIPGNYCVHVDHGVARFAGTTWMGDNGNDMEYLVLEYAGNDKLYVPMEHLDRLTAYVSARDQPPNLTRLGGAEWTKVKERAKEATREMALDLLNLYASRQVARGHQFSMDTTWQQDLEDSFPYEDTPDQSRAVSEVKADMEQPKPMDRLICGDVGYGKTEIALRAAFKTAVEGKQVVLLVPTTVLAQQHYATFKARLSPFPVRVEVLSRFRTPKEQREVIQGLQNGTVDIVIGTHRLLQKDVKFRDLGLVVVDEEQRFGVVHKEQLKQLRSDVEVLSMSATPIPRTLYMALSSIRDMSVVDSPPEARQPIKTFVSEYSEDIIKEAIHRELERNGQVYFLHNRVKTIHQTAARLAEVIPEARVLVAHGQMPESELEEVMLDFASSKANVLVCTTIIESGLDLPNVNTLVLDRADRFGLSQLYQLRGRVGRGDHRAYAYMLVPNGRRITEAAEKRLQAILEASELGSGYRIAMRDLEIRGAGNLLGSAQSGQIYAVGLDLYSQLLEDAVRDLNDQDGSAGTEVSAGGTFDTNLPLVNLPMHAHVPEGYISHLPTRLDIYQRLVRIKQRLEIPEFRAEMFDRFGPPPEPLENLLLLVDLRVLAVAVGIQSVVYKGGVVVLELKNSASGARVPLQRALGPSVSVGNRQIRVPIHQLDRGWLSQLIRVVERIQAFQARINCLSG